MAKPSIGWRGSVTSNTEHNPPCTRTERPQPASTEASLKHAVAPRASPSIIPFERQDNWPTAKIPPDYIGVFRSRSSVFVCKPRWMSASVILRKPRNTPGYMGVSEDRSRIGSEELRLLALAGSGEAISVDLIQCSNRPHFIFN
jgi:hypothetical protein